MVTVAGDRAAQSLLVLILLNEGFVPMEYGRVYQLWKNHFRKMKIAERNGTSLPWVWRLNPRDLVGHYLDPKNGTELISR